MKGQPASVSLLPPAQMPLADASLAAQSQEAVARSAQIYGYTLDPSYSYREIACPFAPRDLLLTYESALPNGAISRFSAVLTRDGTSGNPGHSPVQIIPVLRFGVVPFVPAMSSPHSIEVFNQAVTAAPMGRELLASMQTGQQPLLLRGLCYLALVGAEPAALRTPSLDAATVHAPVPTLQFLEKGRTRQLISIRNSATTYQVWTLTFSPNGKLMTAAREEHPVEPTTPVVLQAATPASPGTSPVAITVGPAVVVPPASPTPPQPAAASQPAPPATPSPAVPTPTPPTEATAAPPQPAEPPNTEPPTAPTSNAPSQPAPAEMTPPTGVTSTPTQPAAPPKTAPPLMAPSAVPPPPAPTEAAAAPQPASSAPPTEVTTASPEAATPPTAPAEVMAAASQPVVHRNLPEPPHRFIPNPPAPPSRIVPASALQSPPHLPQ